jgi:hypothetical protein
MAQIGRVLCLETIASLYGPSICPSPSGIKVTGCWLAFRGFPLRQSRTHSSSRPPGIDCLCDKLSGVATVGVIETQFL